MEKTAIQYIKEAASMLRDKKLRNINTEKAKDIIGGIMNATGLECAGQIFPFLVIFDEEVSGHPYADMNDMARFYGCSSLDIAEYIPDMDRLISLGYVTCRDFNAKPADRKYNMATGVLDSILNNRPVCPEAPGNFGQMDKYSLCDRVDSYIQDCDVPAQRTFFETLHMEENNSDLPIVSGLRELVPDIKDRVLFYELSYDFIKSDGERNSSLKRTMNDIYENVNDRIQETMLIKKGTHTLWKLGLACTLGDDEIGLTVEGRGLLLGDDIYVFSKDYEGLDRYQFAEAMDDYAESSEHGNVKKNRCTYIHAIRKKVESMEKANPQLGFIDRLAAKVDNADDRLLFYLACRECAERDSLRLTRALDKIYNKKESNEQLQLFKKERHVLQIMGLVEIEEQSGFFGGYTELSLTNEGKELFFEEEAGSYIESIDDKNLIKGSSIKARNLFFANELGAQLDLLGKSLEEVNYQNLTARLEAENLPKGIAVLLYGDPGTGKTESVMQIARKTGRDIYHVDISESKSCWFGESEKIIKGIFKKYRNFCKNCTKKPILLFNEADAIFSKRKDVASGSVVQTENAIQNIILEEMEHLDGILIATTNLTENLDPAFERRFLFKIRYERPTIEAKRSIWMDKMHTLSDADAEMLAAAYDFSGGEIDNIVRKSRMKELLEGKIPALADIHQLCDEERIARATSRRIGF